MLGLATLANKGAGDVLHNMEPTLWLLLALVDGNGGGKGGITTFNEAEDETELNAGSGGDDGDVAWYAWTVKGVLE